MRERDMDKGLNESKNYMTVLGVIPPERQQFSEFVALEEHFIEK
jgi:hypothetical protein